MNRVAKIKHLHHSDKIELASPASGALNALKAAPS
jgi:hypothetical protein